MANGTTLFFHKCDSYFCVLPNLGFRGLDEPSSLGLAEKRKIQVNLLAKFSRLPCPIRAREQLSKTLWRVDAHASDGLAVESAEMGFVAGKEGLAPVLDCRGEHRAVFFRQEQGNAWRG